MARAKYHRFGGRVFIVRGDELEEGTDISRTPGAKYIAPLPKRFRPDARKRLGIE